MIECIGVSARAGSFAIHDVSFSVPASAHAILTGPTASGKTTLLELIAGAIRPVAGRVLVDGVDVTHAAPETRGTGLVPQHGYLFPHLDVYRNISYGARGPETVTELVRRFGVRQLMTRSVSSLSGGERQLVALCRALAARPSALLLDEPLSALDAKARINALQVLSAIQRERNFTVLHVSHQESDAQFGSVRFDMHGGTVTRHTRSQSV